MVFKVINSLSINKLRALNVALLFALAGLITLITIHAAVIAGLIGPYEKEVVTLTNSARSKAGLRNLQHIECLNTVAERWSKKMASIDKMVHSTQYPSETSPSMPFTTEISQECGGKWSIVGENIAAGYSSPSTVFNAWMASPSHKANLLRPQFTKTGVGVYRDSDGKHWWTQLFAACSTCTSSWSTTATLPAILPPEPGTFMTDGVATTRADFNSDGKNDLAAIYDNGSSIGNAWIFPSTGTGFTPKSIWTSNAQSWNANRSRVFSGDFNGDGKDDLAAVYDYDSNGTTGIWTWIGQGNNTFNAPSRVWYGTSWNASKSKFTVGDFNRDGKDDLAAVYDYGNSTSKIWTFSSTGTGFTPKTVWTSTSGGWDANKSRLLAGDFNGDNRDDLAALYDYGSGTTGLWTWNGNGDGTFNTRSRVWYDTAWPTAGSYTIGDFNGDNRDDLAAIRYAGSSTSTIWTISNSGSGYTKKNVWSSTSGGWDINKTQLFAGDFNGDNMDDLAAAYDHGNSTTGLWTWNGKGTGAFSAPSRVWSSTSWSWIKGRYVNTD
ncbi:MAG TPA: FG-GAP-like repeat-containing protein [Candidatus Saccharimonadales bacterium]